MKKAKLYRKAMAELAGMTPVQHDYLVRLGAFSPDLGKTRKHYSVYEAALVLIAGQLMPQFKDQRAIVSILDSLREKTKVSYIEPKNFHALYQETVEEERRGREVLADGENLARLVAHHFIVGKGFYNDVYLDDVEFMRDYCERLGLSFDVEFEAAKRRITALSQEGEGWKGQTHLRLVLRLEYFLAIAGLSDHFLQVAGNEDGTAEVVIDSDPMPFSDRILWITMSLGKLFKRLGPYVDESFIRKASDFWMQASKENA